MKDIHRTDRRPKIDNNIPYFIYFRYSFITIDCESVYFRAIS